MIPFVINASGATWWPRLQGSGDEMLKRNMVGAEIWQTADGVITNGCKEAREAILKIYEDAQTGFQQMLDDCALKAARSSDNEVPQSNPVLALFRFHSRQKWTDLFLQ